MGLVTWDMQLYDRHGTPLGAIVEATSRSLQYNLNGIDQLTFNIPLDAAEAQQIKMLTRSVKVWRHVNDPVAGVTYDDPPEAPAFAGVVGNLQKSGNGNQMAVTVFSAYWKLQFRFARANLKIPTKFLPAPLNAPMNCSNYLWQIIHQTNLTGSLMGADGAGRTGIIGPDATGWNGRFAAIDPVKRVWRYQRGSCVWDEIQAKIGANQSAEGSSTAATLELVPNYVHQAGLQRLMFFNTTNHLGREPSNVRAGTWDFHRGANNCEDFQTTETADTSQFANYLILQGQGDGDAYTVTYPKTTAPLAWKRMEDYGIYMHWLQNSKWDSRAAMRAFAAATLFRKGLPTTTYSPTLSPAAGMFYGNDFSLGDNIKVSADYGALQVPDPELVSMGYEITSGANAVRRIYSCQLDLDEFGFERATPTLAPDWSTSDTQLF